MVRWSHKEYNGDNNPVYELFTFNLNFANWCVCSFWGFTLFRNTLCHLWGLTRLENWDFGYTGIRLFLVRRVNPCVIFLRIANCWRILQREFDLQLPFMCISGASSEFAFAQILLTLIWNSDVTNLVCVLANMEPYVQNTMFVVIKILRLADYMSNKIRKRRTDFFNFATTNF